MKIMDTIRRKLRDRTHDKARPAVIDCLDNSDVVRGVLNVVEESYNNGKIKKANKMPVAVNMIMDRMELVGVKVYRDDAILKSIIVDKVEEAHAFESNRVDSRYNEWRGASITIR